MDTIQVTTPVEKNNEDWEKKKNYGPELPFWLEIPTSLTDVLLLTDQYLQWVNILMSN